MRKAEVPDVWRHIYSRAQNNPVLSINLNGLNNLGEIQTSPEIVAICGLNGVGKSTIISAIKDVIGLPLSAQDQRRINGHTVSGQAMINGQAINCSNEETKRFFDKEFPEGRVTYLDCIESINIQNYIIGQTNFDELIEQFEPRELTGNEIRDISYIVGKDYEACTIWELEDIDGRDASIPFFRVSLAGVQYDSAGMGAGEHFLLYLFWSISSAQAGTLLIIEEPETNIGISSQINFVNYLGRQIEKKNLKVILTTHSPYILQYIQNDHIRIVSRMGDKTAIMIPDERLSAENILGVDNTFVGTIFVEDQVASDLLMAILVDKAPYILKKYTVDVVGGESNITKRLEFPRSDKIRYNFIGVYDGDMRSSFDKNDFQWNYCFLPGEKQIEDVFRDYIKDGSNLSRFCLHLNMDENRIITILSSLSGEDCHDWFLDLMKALSLSGRDLVLAFYNLFMRDESDVDAFVKELQRCTTI
ncbi:MAG: hypothetical protein E7425_03225 [Ruminococcaceae bacterium]|nr:hypothetical protein [Oscillospiraceae bacterium]